MKTILQIASDCPRCSGNGAVFECSLCDVSTDAADLRSFLESGAHTLFCGHAIACLKGVVCPFCDGTGQKWVDVDTDQLARELGVSPDTLSAALQKSIKRKNG